MIRSSGGRSRSFWRVSRGLLIARLRCPKTDLQGITRRPDSGIPNRKKIGLNTLYPCKTKYFLSANQTNISRLCRFFTDDERQHGLKALGR